MTVSKSSYSSVSKTKIQEWVCLSRCLILLSRSWSFYGFSESSRLQRKKETKWYAHLFNIVFVVCLFNFVSVSSSDVIFSCVHCSTIQQMCKNEWPVGAAWFIKEAIVYSSVSERTMETKGGECRLFLYLWGQVSCFLSVAFMICLLGWNELSYAV